MIGLNKGKGDLSFLPDEWHALTQMDELANIIAKSARKPQLLFKHSTRCSISSMAFSRLKGGLAELSPLVDVHYLDLIAHRNISNAIADTFGVAHQSPQTLLIHNGECELEQDHMDIRVSEVVEVATALMR